MNRIAIIDDNTSQSGTLAKKIRRLLRLHDSDLEVISQTPFVVIEDYFTFIEEKNVCVLILDQRLNDQPSSDGEPVTYTGDQLVESLRERLRDFPIFMITTYSDDSEVESKFSQFERIISRDEFNEDGDKYIPILVRSAQRFLDENENELSEFNSLSQAIAGGSDDPQKLMRFQALQVKLELPLASFNDRNSWLEKYEEHIKELEELKSELSKTKE